MNSPNNPLNESWSTRATQHNLAIDFAAGAGAAIATSALVTGPLELTLLPGVTEDLAQAKGTAQQARHTAANAYDTYSQIAGSRPQGDPEVDGKLEQFREASRQAQTAQTKVDHLQHEYYGYVGGLDTAAFVGGAILAAAGQKLVSHLCKKQ